MASTPETTTQREFCHCMIFSRSKWERITNAPSERKQSWWHKGLNLNLNPFKKTRGVVGDRCWAEMEDVIRRFNKNNGMKSGKFEYDPLSYSLNFDDEDRIYCDFSSRYASIPVMAKSSMDLGTDAPSFT
ncbi:hypothetical protein LOK49_LG04G03707 [Camellia lanceoleosa]|uniref:Uncharacterized protein n=1 Tax=Camellia lanceoleosa TaxID=1840588 RepID=A0ACC0HWF0_9ERIC|nr:hypothetical protein LOK49_LG04G03707 [Camellia lanceoleosa]